MLRSGKLLKLDLCSGIVLSLLPDRRLQFFLASPAKRGRWSSRSLSLIPGGFAM
jgi:hypothetical protein